MCWSSNMAIPIVLKKPLKVYKVGTSTILDGFISLHQNFIYLKYKTVPTIKINPMFVRCHPSISYGELWYLDDFYIFEGYHSYLTAEMAKYRNYEHADIGVFEIPVGATVYVNYRHKEVVSTDIKYLGLLEE